MKLKIVEQHKLDVESFYKNENIILKIDDNQYEVDGFSVTIFENNCYSIDMCCEACNFALVIMLSNVEYLQ